MIGNEIHALAKRLWPLNRSITGDGVRETLKILKETLPDLQIREVATGTKVFDWTVPKEWKAREAWIVSPSGEKICDFKENNLHLVGYSTPVNLKLSLEELNAHLHSLPNQPKAIPYITSYYQERWGFCLSHEKREQLSPGIYEVYIDSELIEGSLTYGELLIEGNSSKEVFISTYVCHPSMANNELSGPTVTTFLAKWITEQKSKKYSYRIIFIPETIGAITYLSRHLEDLKKNVIAGFNVTCIGDDREYSYLPSRRGNTLSDDIAKHVLKHIHPSFKMYKWSDRGSDERQYCAPFIDLPIASIMRTKYGVFPEYHTSLDDLVNVVTPSGLEGGFNALRLSIEAIEKNCFPKVTTLGEPQLGRRGLYPTLSTKASADEVGRLLDFISWSDGTNSLLKIAELCEAPIWTLYPLLNKLLEKEVVEI